ncbi:TcfC E-set like domain-containing protein [Parendozoicomonas haliclonae]|uniref:Fimbrial Usher protein n=1 Tax=Parendozoicomonas haliclonae TaxID=1960125 RepID=A0A1X7AIP0_9GAMM|nr:TcfC E-set like domain-containing protein [Parendozoicomonas haliclonae]SMA39296.1 Fimbrial Usher protein [Parendozoicomonas haliclonae]
MTNKLRLSALIIMILALCPALGAEPVFIAKAEVPAGFEALSRPQRSLIDIYYGNRYIASQIATFTAQTIELSDPESVVQRIPDITRPVLVAELLTGELPSNADEICLPRQIQGCGRLNPAVAGVIFDEGRFRLDLFINRDYLRARPADIRKYLPPSQSGWAFMQNFSANATGNDASEGGNSNNDYTLTGQSLLSWRENSLLAGWDYTRERNLTIDTLYAQREFKGIAWQGGMVNGGGFGLNFTSGQTVLGARVATSDNTRLDSDYSGGIPLDVFLPTRGRVELRRDERLLFSAFYEAGNQQLNTSSLPDGAYDLNIRVVDERGNTVSEETRFFAKQGNMPAPGEWEWFVEAGDVLNRTADNTLPRTTGQYLARAGMGYRLADDWSGTLAVAADNNESLTEMGLFHIGNGWDISPSVMLSADGDHGFGVNGRTRLYDLSLSGSYRRLWSEDDINDIATLPGDENRLIGDGFEQFSGSASVPFVLGSLNYRYSYNQRGDNTASKTHSLNWRAQLWRTSDYDLDFDLGLSKSGDNEVILATLSLQYSDDRWDFGVSPSMQWDKSSDNRTRTERTQLSAGWNDGDLLDGEMRFNGGLALEGDQKTLNGNLNYSDHRGSGSLAVSHLRAGNTHSTSYSLNAGTSFITDGDIVSVGGEERAQSAVVINITGRDGDRFHVNVNGQRRGYAVVGQPSIIPLSPYDEYLVSVLPAGTAIYQFEEKVERVTLYPGNVVRMDMEAIPMQLAFGRIVFDGSLGEQDEFNARLMGGLLPVQISDIGMFQIEVRADTPELRLEMDNGWACRIELPQDTQKDILRLGTIKLSEADCQPALDGKLVLTKAE